MTQHSLSSMAGEHSRFTTSLALLSVAILMFVPATAQAQAFPTRPVTVIVPFAAGGPTDILARIMAEGMSKELAQPVVIENTPGAGGTVGNARAARAAPDGYTLLVGNVGTLAANGAMYKKLAYNVLTDFTPLGSMGNAPQVISARKDFPAAGPTQFSDYVRAHATALNVGAAGTGSGSYLGAVLVNDRLGANVKVVNYRGAGQALNDVIAGHIDYMVDSTTTSAAYIRAGTVKGIMVLRPKRIKALPDVPSASEFGLPDLEYDIWNMMLVPKGASEATIERLNRALRKAINSPEAQARLQASGVEIPSERQQTPEGAAELLASSVTTWRTLLAKLGVTAD